MITSMNRFKERWEIQNNWQLLWPIVGLIGLGYSSFKLAQIFGIQQDVLTIIIGVALFAILLHFTLKLFKFLESRWKVDQRWKVIRIFIVFAITGSLSVVVTKPVFEWVGLIKANFDSNFISTTFYFILKFILILPFYKILLVFFGWVFGEYKFFLNFAVKLANRLGLKRLTQHLDSK